MNILVTVAAALTIGQAQTTEPRLMRTPDVRGDTLVFSYAGDLWVASTSGGIARRLTSHPSLEINPRISPDGKTVAFTGAYDGSPNIYTIPIEGGEPKRLTYNSEPTACRSWTPDGKIAYISTAGNFINRQTRLWYVDPKGGMPIRTSLDEVSEVSFFPDGKRIAYNRMASSGFNWRRYRGGSQGKISFYDFSTNSYSELPAKREQSYWPMVVGNSVFYISSKGGNGTINMFRYDLDSKKDTQLTKFEDADVRTPWTDGKTISYERDGSLFLYDIASGRISRPNIRILSENLQARPMLRQLGQQLSDISLSPSGARIAVEARGELFSVPAKQGDTRNFTNTSGARERFPKWSPDSKTIAYVSDATGNYEIYAQPQMGGVATRLTTSTAGTIVSLEWAPNSKMLGFAKKDGSYWLLDVASKKVTQIIKPDYGIEGADWSPDSKWIAMNVVGKNLFGSLHLYEIATGKLTQVDDGFYSNQSVAFDKNGKYLYFASTRSFAPSFGAYEFSLKVDEGQRIYVIPLAKETPNPLTTSNDEEPEPPPIVTPPASGASGGRPTNPPAGGAPGAQSQAGPPATGRPGGDTSSSGPVTKVDLDGMSDRVLPLPMPAGSYPGMIGSTNGLFYVSGGTLIKFDFTTKESTPILPGLRGPVGMNPSQSKIAYYAGGQLYVVDVRPGIQPGQGRVETGAVEAVITPRDEWKQIFWEAWRFERDNYYDPEFRGLDWTAVGKRYERYLDYVTSRIDLNYVMGLMVGELGTSHAYVSGGDIGLVNRPIPVGLLGADYEVVGGKVKISKIYRGRSYEEQSRAPLVEPGVDVREGDFLLAIDGKPVDANTPPGQHLLGKVGRFVTLTLNSTPSEVGARKVRVRPVPDEGGLRYADWVEGNRRMVDKLSGGRIGYMHISDTASQGAIDFVRGFYPQTDKDAIIVDERWNGGGYIQPWFVDTLARRVRAGIQSRNGADSTDAVAIEGPKVMLINGYAGSGGDFFPWMFRQSKLGPLIGKRTWGGLVGISGAAPLVDGGGVTAPSFSIYDRDTGEIIAENRGVDPDMDVDRRPDLVARGKDPQIEAAVAYLTDQLKKNPPRKPRKVFPKLGKDGVIKQ